MAEIKIFKKVVCAWGDLHGEIVGRSLFRRLTRDQPTPCFVAFMNNLGSIFFVLGFTRERKRILWFSIRNLVNPKLKPPSTSLSQLMFFFFAWYLNHSLVARIKPGKCLSTSSTSLSLEASGSVTSTTRTFQSVSPSSRRAMIPSTLTCLT